jgi:arginine decarboxylase
MNTPICDFVREYAKSGALRLHMPGHKGRGPLGIEELDITEITGADSLYEASGIIRESEAAASQLFGCPTFYSTEGSSLCIRAMLYLARLHAARQGKKPVILAGRNAHKTFLSAAALLDLDVIWLSPERQESYLSCAVSASQVEAALAADEAPAAVYITSPDYLGNTVDIRAIADACHRRGALLIVDNAHGAYLRFLEKSRHPMDLGADMCCDSAHKTLPVLTGGAYLHMANNAPEALVAQAKNALALFGSTSPSYLILQSLDAVNGYLADGYRAKLADFAEKAERAKEKLRASGYALRGDEPIKITISAKPYGYRGTELQDILMQSGLVCEFADPDFLVFMVTPETGEDGLKRLTDAMLRVPKRPAVDEQPPVFRGAEKAMSIRDAIFSPGEVIPAWESAGRVLAAPTVGCPPAVPIVVSGEKIDAHAIECFAYYEVETCAVVKENS